MRVSAFRENLKRARERRRLYDRAMSELRLLDEREMMELGLNASQFHELALQDVARRMPEAA